MLLSKLGVEVVDEQIKSMDSFRLMKLKERVLPVANIYIKH